jgi:outer membrane biosynthesis protein TonB
MLIKTLLSILLSISLIPFSYGFELNGIGSYQQLRKEFYIGALYLTKTNNDPTAIITSNTSKRMALKVTAKRWSPRRWSLQWQNDIAINNSFDDDPELTKQLMLFTGFLDDNLTTGDEIIIDYVAASGTTVSINGVPIIETKTAKFFNYLLKVWIGKLPPSGEFKSRMLGKKDSTFDALFKQYNQISYDKQRSEVIASWIQSHKDALLAEQRKKEQIQQKLLLAKIKKKNAIIKAKAEKNKKSISIHKKKTYIEPKKTIKKKVISKRKKVASIKPNFSKTKTKKELIAEDKYYLDLYKWELTREIRNSVEYPEWAKKFGQKGNVILNFTVTRKAEVKDVNGNNPDISVLLTSELHRAILAVVPFILPPDALNGNSWKMSINYKFNPNSDKQTFIKKPKKLASLTNNNKINRASYNRILSQYVDDIKDTIYDKIEYPVWAKKLNKKGKVIFEVIIKKDGSIDEIIEKVVSRHDTLNKEIRDAIQNSQPLPSIPDSLKLNRTRITIEHEFK